MRRLKLRFLGAAAASTPGHLTVDAPMIREPRLLQRRRKPLTAVRVNDAHPLAPDYMVISMPEGPRVLLSPGNNHSVTNTGAPAQISDHTNYNGTSQYSALPGIELGINHTLMLHASLLSKNNGGASGVEGMLAKGFWGADDSGDTRIINQSTSNVVQFQVNTGADDTVNIAHADITVGVPYVFVGTSEPSTGKIFLDGAKKNTNNSTWPASMTANTRGFTIGAYPNNEAATESVMDFFAAAVWTRTLDEGEVLNLSLDPYQYLIPA